MGTYVYTARALTNVSNTYDWIHKAGHYAIFRVQG